MTWPVPQPGLVIRYSYLWESEAQRGCEEGVKDRPCAIILVILREGEHPIVRVLPITHTAPSDLADALEIPATTKQRLKLIFNSCRVGLGCKSLILQEAKVGFCNNVVPRFVANRLINVT